MVSSHSGMAEAASPAAVRQAGPSRAPPGRASSAWVPHCSAEVRAGGGCNRRGRFHGFRCGDAELLRGRHERAGQQNGARADELFGRSGHRIKARVFGLRIAKSRNQTSPPADFLANGSAQAGKTTRDLRRVKEGPIPGGTGVPDRREGRLGSAGFTTGCPTRRSSPSRSRAPSC